MQLSSVKENTNMPWLTADDLQFGQSEVDVSEVGDRNEKKFRQVSCWRNLVWKSIFEVRFQWLTQQEMNDIKLQEKQKYPAAFERRS